MSKPIEHFFKPVGGNDSSSSKAVHAAAVLATQKETEQAFAKIKMQKFRSAGNSRKFRIVNISTHMVYRDWYLSKIVGSPVPLIYQASMCLL